MLDLNISRLSLSIENSFGHVHRVQPIALRAATMLTEHISARYHAGGRSPRSVYLDAIIAPMLRLDLNHTSDEQAAAQIAGAWLAALAPHLEV
jgi:hypothetical protein